MAEKTSGTISEYQAVDLRTADTNFAIRWINTIYLKTLNELYQADNAYANAVYEERKETLEIVKNENILGNVVLEAVVLEGGRYAMNYFVAENSKFEGYWNEDDIQLIIGFTKNQKAVNHNHTLLKEMCGIFVRNSEGYYKYKERYELKTVIRQAAQMLVDFRFRVLIRDPHGILDNVVYI